MVTQPYVDECDMRFDKLFSLSRLEVFEHPTSVCNSARSTVRESQQEVSKNRLLVLELTNSVFKNALLNVYTRFGRVRPVVMRKQLETAVTIFQGLAISPGHVIVIRGVSVVVGCQGIELMGTAYMMECFIVAAKAGEAVCVGAVRYGLIGIELGGALSKTSVSSRS